jgi:hypothetical protein
MQWNIIPLFMPMFPKILSKLQNFLNKILLCVYHLSRSYYMSHSGHPFTWYLKRNRGIIPLRKGAQKKLNQPHTCPMRVWRCGSLNITLRSQVLPRWPWSIGLLKGWNRGGCTANHSRSQCKGWSSPTPYAFIHFTPLIILQALSLFNSALITPSNGPWRPIGLWDVEAPTASRQSTHR